MTTGEEEQLREAPYREDAPEGHSFDEFAKKLANGTTSRRRALKMIAGALFDTSLLGLLPGTAGAQQSVGGGGGGGHSRNHPKHHHHRSGGGEGAHPAHHPVQREDRPLYVVRIIRCVAANAAPRGRPA
jgi:hypothetical protein